MGCRELSAVAREESGFEAWSRRQLAEVERALEAWVPAEAPAGLGEAMRYGVLDGGKRLQIGRAHV